MAKTVPNSKFTEWKGLDRIQQVVHDMKCIWREMEILDAARELGLRTTQILDKTEHLIRQIGQGRERPRSASR